MNTNYKSPQSLLVGDTFVLSGQTYIVTAPVAAAESRGHALHRRMHVPTDKGFKEILISAPLKMVS